MDAYERYKQERYEYYLSIGKDSDTAYAFAKRDAEQFYGNSH